MNDDELIERLRRTLRAEADAVTPMHGTPRILPPGRRRRSRMLGLPTGAVAGMVAAAAVAAAVAVAVSVHGGSPHASTVISPAGATKPSGPRNDRQRPLTTVPRARTTPTTAPAPSTTAPATTTPSTTPVTTPATTDPLPEGFAPRSVTFVSGSDGWVLGEAPCGTTTCTSIGATTDRGTLWHRITAPAVPVGAAAAGDLQIRFATPERGWVYDTAPGDGQIWVTTDGGSSWSPVTVPGDQGATVDDLEVAHGTVVVALTSGQGTTAGTVGVYSGPAGSDAFSLVQQFGPPAGGSSETATVAMQDTDAWVLVSNDRGVIGGLRLTGGTWGRWRTTPCHGIAGAALLAASGPQDLVASCESDFSSALTTTVEASTDAGSSFTAVRAAGVPQTLSALASPAAGTIVAASTTDPGSLLATVAGSAWRTVAAATSGAVLQVGFESATQGIAVVEQGSGGTLLMTEDGGSSWQAVPFTR